MGEIKKELSRQAAAHNNHLAQMLRIQHDELEAIYKKYLRRRDYFKLNCDKVLFIFHRQLINEKEKIRHEFYSKVAESLGRAKGIENALNGISFLLLCFFYLRFYLN